jgi:hypothetical protein
MWGKRMHFPAQIRSVDPQARSPIPRPLVVVNTGGSVNTSLFLSHEDKMSSTSATGHDRNNGSDTMSPSDSNGKRKSEDASAQPRAKRNRYISIAWYDMRLLTSGEGCNG